MKTNMPLKMLSHSLMLTTMIVGILLVVFIDSDNFNITEIEINGLQPNFGFSIGLPLILFKLIAGMAISNSKMTVSELIKSELWQSLVFLAFFASDFVLSCTYEISGAQNASLLLWVYSFRFLAVVSWTASMFVNSMVISESRHWILDPCLHATSMAVFASIFQICSMETFLRSSHARFETIATTSWCLFFTELFYITGYWLCVCRNEYLDCWRWFEMDMVTGCYLFLLVGYVTCDGIIGLVADGSIGMAVGLTTERVKFTYCLQSAYITAAVILPTLISAIQAMERFKNALEEQVPF